MQGANARRRLSSPRAVAAAGANTSIFLLGSTCQVLLDLTPRGINKTVTIISTEVEVAISLSDFEKSYSGG